MILRGLVQILYEEKVDEDDMIRFRARGRERRRCRRRRRMGCECAREVRVRVRVRWREQLGEGFQCGTDAWRRFD